MLRRIWLRQSIALAAWNGAIVTCAGLAIFIVAGEPQGGRPAPASQHWIIAITVTMAATAALALAAQHGSPTRKAALWAIAAGLTWALEATFIKATTDTITESEISPLCRATAWNANAPIWAAAPISHSGLRTR